MGSTSRDRILTEALRLFGERGFAATTVAQIEQAAGLSAGSGALYRHFRSKDELLVTAIRSRLADRDDGWDQFLAPEFSVAGFLESFFPESSLVDRLVALCRIGLARLEHNRDVTRVLFRDNSAAPEALEVFRREEWTVVASVVTRGLAELAPPERRDEDWEATGAVIFGAVAHYWLLTDIFGGQHPATVDADRYLRATAEMIAARLGHGAGAHRKERP